MQYVLNENGSVSVQGIQKKKKKNKTSNVSSNTQTIKTNDTNDTRTVKTSKSETKTFNNNDIRTIKTESPKKQGIIGQTGQVLESGLSGAFSGITALADVPFQEAQEQAQKGKKIKTQDDLVKEGIKGIARSLVPAYNMIEGNKEVTKKVKNLFKDKKKTTTQKIVGTGLAALNNEGLDNTYQGVKNAFKIWGAVNPNLDKQIANVQSKIDAPAQKWQEKVQEENAQLGKPFQIASDVSGVIGNMAPAALGTYLTKDPNVGRVMLAASAKGQSTKDALQRGTDIETANDVGMAKGLTEVGTEMATGGLNFLGKGALDDVAKGFIDKKVGKPMLNFIGKKMLGIAGENAEEVASDLIGNLIDRGAIDPNATYTKEDFLNTLLMTTLSTGAMNTLSGGYGRNAYRQNIAEMQESRGINGNNLNTINNSVPSTQQVREVNEIQQRAQNGEISYEQANQQLAQVQDGTYQQNQLIESMASQEVERIQQAVQTGQMSPAEASQEIQAINNTLTSERERINQPQQEIKVEARETKSSENKAEPKQEEKEQSKANVEVGKQYTYSANDGRNVKYEVKEIRDDGKVKIKINSSSDKNLVGQTVILKGDNAGIKNAQEYKSNIKYEDLSKDASSTRYDKKMYAKAKNTKMDMSNYDKTMEFIIPNKRGNYSREQILTLAEELGKKSKAKTGAELKQEAINYWVNKEPFKKTDSKTKYLKMEEFLKSYYKGAGVGTKIENKGKTITATNSNNQEVKLKEKNGVYTRQDVVDEVKNIENQFKNQTLKAKNGEKVSNFYSNITEKAQFIEPETRESLKSERSIKFYKSVTNEQALQEAVDIIGTTPASQAKALNDFLTKQDQFTATDMAEGWVFLKQYQDVGNYDAMASVAKKMREMGTKSGQAIQMLGLEARLTPEGMYRFAVNELAQAEEKYNKQKGRTKKDIEQHRKNFQLTPEETEFIKRQMEKVQGMEEGRARDIEVAKINKMLTDKLPHTKGQSLKAWMRISMLFNPKTQVRNIMGNALITPVNALSDVASGAVDRVVAKKTGARTIGGPSLGGLVSYTKGGTKGIGEAWQDYRMGIDTKNINQDRFDIGQGKQFNEQHRGPLKGVRNFVAKQLNKTNDLLAFVMDAGDRFFLQGSVENSLYNQQKLNNTKEITKDMYDLAENEGLQRTWNDNNQFTKAVLNIRRAINDIGGLMHIKVGEYGLGDLMIPFAKTPANLTKAIVDYSPAGFLTAINEGKNLKRAIETGNYSLQQQHDFSQAVGKATAGTLLYALGIALAKAKITTGDSDEDKDLKNFMRYNLGIQPYSIKIGNKSFTYDWAQPVAAPFAITADIQKGMSEEMTPAQAIQQFLTTGFNILTEQSFLSGINEVLNDNDGLLHGIEQQVINMPATAIPTLLKQFTDMTDGTKRQTYSKEGMTENAKKYAQSKIPTESKKLAPQVDVLGNEIQKYGGDNNAFNVFLNPSNTEKGKSNEVSKEIYALYEATGDKTIIPKKVDYTITKDGKKKILTTQEMEKWQKASGKYVTDNVRKAMNTPKYQRMSDVDKATVINKIVNYSYMKAKSEVFDLPISSYYSAISKAESKGIPMYDYYISKIKEDKK